MAELKWERSRDGFTRCQNADCEIVPADDIRPYPANGYVVTYEDREIGEARTQKEAKAIAQAHHDRGANSKKQRRPWFRFW